MTLARFLLSTVSVFKTPNDHYAAVDYVAFVDVSSDACVVCDASNRALFAIHWIAIYLLSVTDIKIRLRITGSKLITL